MKYINLNTTDVTVEFNSYPNKAVKPGAAINLSSNKFNDLVNKNLNSLGLKKTRNRDLQKFVQTDKYKDLVKSRKDIKNKVKKVKKDQNNINNK